MSSSSNLWTHKPWWCQPWTIILTGISIIGGSWLSFHRLWLTAIISTFITLWWVYFLIIVPRLFKQLSEENEQGKNFDHS